MTQSNKGGSPNPTERTPLRWAVIVAVGLFQAIHCYILAPLARLQALLSLSIYGQPWGKQGAGMIQLS